METIEERAKECSEGYDDDGYSAGLYMGYVEGAYDQKAIDEEVRLKKCADMTPKECEREMAFVDWYYKNGKGTPTFSDAIEWTRQKTIENAKNAFNAACGWLSTYTWYNAVVEEFVKVLEEEQLSNESQVL